MTSAFSRFLVICALIVPQATPLVAGPMSPAFVGGALSARPQVQLAAFGDGPTTGGHRGRRNRTGDVPQAVAPSHADMHGATRESADQIYRKKYGF